MKSLGDLVFIIGVVKSVSSSGGTQCLSAVLEAQNKLITHVTCSLQNFVLFTNLHFPSDFFITTFPVF